MSRKGNCWDNTVAESFFATLKKAIGVYETKAQAHAAIASYIHGFYTRSVCIRRSDTCHPKTISRRLKLKNAS